MKFLLIINNEVDGVGQPAVNLSSNIKKKDIKQKLSLYTNSLKIKI